MSEITWEQWMLETEQRWIEITATEYLAKLEFYNQANNYGIALHIK
jgi:hypothetical protein